MRRIAIVALVVLAGCDTGPDPLPAYDPRDSLDRLERVLDRLDRSHDLFLGLALATAELYDMAVADQGGAAAALAPIAGRLSRSGSTIRRAAPGALDRAGLRTMMSMRPLVTFPSGLRGRTLVWDPQAGYVVDPDRVGAPSGAVRLVRYRMDRVSGLPVLPLDATGYMDFIGEGRATSDRIRIVAVDQTGASDRVVADYFVDAVASGGASSGTFRWSAVGSIGASGGVFDFDLVQLFTWDLATDREELLAEYRYVVPGGAVHLEIEGESAFEAADWANLWFLARFDPGQALDAEMDVFIASNGALDGVFRRLGRDVIRVSGTDGSPHFARTDGRGLTSAERSALNGIWDGTSDVTVLTEWVIYPAYLLLVY